MMYGMVVADLATMFRTKETAMGDPAIYVSIVCTVVSHTQCLLLWAALCHPWLCCRGS